MLEENNISVVEEHLNEFFQNLKQRGYMVLQMQMIRI